MQINTHRNVRIAFEIFHINELIVERRSNRLNR